MLKVTRREGQALRQNGPLCSGSPGCRPPPLSGGRRRGSSATGPRRTQLLCFSAGKKLQLQRFLLSQACLGLFPESDQVVQTEHLTPAASPLCSQLACWEVRDLQRIEQAGSAYDVGTGPMWHSLDLRDSCFLNNNVKSTSCMPTPPRGPVECCQGKGKMTGGGKRRVMGYQRSPREEEEVAASLGTCQVLLPWIIRPTSRSGA